MTSENRPVVVAFPAAFAVERDGSHARVASLLNRIAAEFDNVIVYGHENHHDYPWTDDEKQAFEKRWPDVELVVERYTLSMRVAAAAKNLIISIFPKKAASLLAMKLPGASPRFDEIKSRTPILIVNYKFVLSQLNGVPASECFVETHDLLCLKWARLQGESPISVSVLRKMRGEVAALDTTAGVFAISPAETNFFRLMLSKAPTFYIPSWDKPQAKAPPVLASVKYDLVFVASSYVMNIRGFCEMLEAHGDWLSQYTVAVCGRICEDPEFIEAVSPFPLITLLGFVENVEEIYAISKAALVPVGGTGLKMKLVAALGSGLPVFASLQAFEGLPSGYAGAVMPIDEMVVQSTLSVERNLLAAQTAAVQYFDVFNSSGDDIDAVSAIRSHRE